MLSYLSLGGESDHICQIRCTTAIVINKEYDRQAKKDHARVRIKSLLCRDIRLTVYIVSSWYGLMWPVWFLLFASNDRVVLRDCQGVRYTENEKGRLARINQLGSNNVGLDSALAMFRPLGTGYRRLKESDVRKMSPRKHWLRHCFLADQ